MFSNLWNFFNGYVMIEVTGFSIERFLNMASRKSVKIWDITHDKSKVTFKISAKEVRNLKNCAKKTGCRLKILEKEGLPFVKHKYRKRKILAGGILFFMVFLYIMSSFIWVVEISGNNRIPKDRLILFCEEIGLKPGALKRTISTNEASMLFLENFADLSWIAVNISGTKISIEVVETIEKLETIDKTTPCDIIAKTDALVTDVTVSNGTPLVRVRDVVQKGDVLVSGMLEITEDAQVKDYHYIHATANVYGKVWYEINLSEPLDYTVKNYTGKMKKRYSIELFGKRVDFFTSNRPFEEFELVTKEDYLKLGGDFALPIKVIRYELKEYHLEQNRHSYEEAVDILNKKIDEVINKKLENLDEEVIIVEKRVDFSAESNANEKVDAHAVVTSIERIDLKKEISPLEIMQMPEFAVPKEDETDEQQPEIP